ncbi:osmolarity sensory histidine kinase EnvZ [Vibrio variabilis]|uniref:Osmolarity sensory histidine kinase EnvZ n=1 Tax=Vibrio variabilis TaxID=990271 RepID=A0ABQ0J5W6_9VIBR|nr:osmolarity sensory histidine kinase EnvZ [Vibrio variabilis]
MGLAIVKRIISQHHGSVSITNRSGGGLKAQVSFPVPKATKSFSQPDLNRSRKES